jgi:cysteinyl-tRNA synthetase
MILKELGEQIDIHVGGVDLKFPHHTNEIAQSEAVTGKSGFAKYWVHGEFLLVDGEKMSKSKNNFYNLSDVVERGIEPLAVRYLMLQSHYRKQLNFTWKSLEAAAKGLERLKERISSRKLRPPQARLVGILGWQAKVKDQESSWEERFRERVRDDLDMPGALVVLQGMLDSELGVKVKLELVKKWDRVLGLGLTTDEKSTPQRGELQARALISKREELRRAGKFDEADKIRGQLTKLGVKVQDEPVVK